MLELLTGNQLLDKLLFDSNVSYPNHNMFTMKVDAYKATSAKLNFKPTYSMTRLEKVSSKHEEVKTYEVTVKHALENLVPVFVASEVSRAGKGRMEEQTDICIWGCFFDITWHHEQ